MERPINGSSTGCWNDWRRADLIKGKTIGGGDSTDTGSQCGHEVDDRRRDTGESYNGYLQRLAEAEGVNAGRGGVAAHGSQAPEEDFATKSGRARSDGEAEITKREDGRTALAFKAENAVDMETGAIVAVTTHGGGAAADTATVEATVIEAGAEVAGLVSGARRKASTRWIAAESRKSVADKGYHSNEVAVGSSETGSADLHRGTGTGRRNWERQAGGKEGSRRTECGQLPGESEERDAAAAG